MVVLAVLERVREVVAPPLAAVKLVDHHEHPPLRRTRVSNRRTGSRVRCPTLADGEGKVG